jgi:GNAT superfamily N-acetyltransferase
MEVIELKYNSNYLVEAFNGLLPQLSSSFKSISAPKMDELINSDNTKILVAVDGDLVLGTLTLVIVKIPTGIKAWIEDVVVDEKARGKGVAKLLMSSAHKLAKELACSSINLTSTPKRVEANNLYQSLGYKLRNTNYYRLSINE